MPEISTKEWRFIALFSALIIIITFLPNLVGILAIPKDSIFLGTQRINVEDTPIYYSWIEQVKEGHLLFKNLYTSENDPRFIFDPFWLGVGLFAKIFSLSGFAAYQLARIFLIPIFLGVAYIFISYFLKEEQRRKICFIFLVFTSGLGGLTALGIEAGLFRMEPAPMDLWVAEAITFFTLYHTPHFIASILLTLLIFFLFLRAISEQKIIYSFLAGLSALFLFQFHPYYVPTIFGVLGVYIIVQSLRASHIRWSLIKHFLILVLISLPSILYHLWTLNTFWTRQQFALQNNLTTPPPYNLLLTYGFVFLLSLAGIIYLLLKKEKNDKEIFLLSWWGANLFLVYAPFLNFQRRLLESMHPVLVITAILGLFYLKNLLQNKNILQKSFFKKTPVLIILFSLLFTFSNYYIIIRDLNFYSSHNPYAFLNIKKQEAMLWLKKNTPEESVIFSTYRNGNLIPAFAARTVYLGSWGNTAASRIKQDEVKRFFEIISDGARATFLKINNIDYLFFGPEEKAAANFDPNTADYLDNVYQNREVTIYKVKKE